MARTGIAYTFRHVYVVKIFGFSLKESFRFNDYYYYNCFFSKYLVS